MIVIPRLKSIHIKNFKSISEVTIDFPEDKPIILIGENNSGKSNILRAIDLMFGDYHPSYIKMDIQEDFNINLKKNSKAHNIEISIVAEVDDFVIIDEKDNKEKEIKNFSFSCKRGEMPSYYAVTKDKRYKDKHGIKKDQKQKIYAVFINNEETLNYHLSYSSKNTLLSKFTKAFHEKLKRDDDKVKNLVSIYRNIVEQMRGLEEYRKFEDDFKNLSNGVFANMKGFLELDFSCYDPLNYYKNLSMIFRNSNDGSLEPQSFTMLGSGQKKIIMFLLSYCYAKNFKMQENLILLIDEPESNLHPVAQKWFAKKLYEFSKEGLQIVISTHSPYFINLDYIDSIYLLKKNESGTYVVKNNAYSLSEHCRNRGASKSDQ
ncbi:MAG: ATP-binding protein, partial [bacterium]|nr:ATP-binding protein [bacterium]